MSLPLTVRKTTKFATSCRVYLVFASGMSLSVLKFMLRQENYRHNIASNPPGGHSEVRLVIMVSHWGISSGNGFIETQGNL